MRKLRRLAIAATLGLLLSTLTAMPVQAAQTSTTCDSVPKYYCAYVVYVDEGGYVDNLSRAWEGALGGSGCPTYCTTKDWRIWWVQDWTWNGSGWSFQRNFGQSSWYQNGSFLGYNTYNGYTISTPALVNFMFCYHDYYSDTGTNVYWTSPQLDHYLDGSAPDQVGGGGSC